MQLAEYRDKEQRKARLENEEQARKNSLDVLTQMSSEADTKLLESKQRLRKELQEKHQHVSLLVVWYLST
jgi:hypothetical protein